MKRYFMYFSVVLAFTLLIITTVTVVQDESSNFAIPLQHYFKRSIRDCFYIASNVTFKEKSATIAQNPVENLPTIYLGDNPKTPTEFNKTCAKFPKLFEIKYTSDFWQTLVTTNGSLQLFSAYVDDRLDNWYIRIIAAYDQFNSNESFYCHIWYDNVKAPAVVKSDNLTWIWIKGWGGNRTGLYHSYMVSCPLSKDQIPMSVSVVQNPCDTASNNLRISYQKAPKKKKNFVVCVKGLNFPFEDKSTRIAEWIELLLLLGADEINFYHFNLHPSTKKLLEYYSEQGKVKLTPISLVGGISNSPYLQNRFLKQMVLHRRLQEVIPYNDCLYKHIRQFNYVVLLDTDEVIVPINGTWADLLKIVYKEDKSSYMARNIYFLDSHQHNHEWFEGIPKFMHMLQHVYRAENYTKPGHFVKGFHDTRKVFTLHNHFPFKCLGGCKPLSIDMSLAHLQHYRSDCVKGVKECDLMKNNSIMDTRLWNYKDELVGRVLYVLTKLDLLSVVGDGER